MLSNEFNQWFDNTFKDKLSKSSYRLYLHYSKCFCEYAGTDFLEYSPENSTNYYAYLMEMLDSGKYKPKTVYNILNILSNIAQALELSLGVPDNFSSLERPEVEYPELTLENVPSTEDVDRLLDAARTYSCYPDFFYAAFYLICTYALSVSEILHLNSENVYVDYGHICIVRKEHKHKGYNLPTVIMLDNAAEQIIEPFYCRMKELSKSTKTPVLLFSKPDQTPYTINMISYHYGVMKSGSLFENDYTLRDFRTGALVRIARIGGRDSLLEVAALRSFWAERYVEGSSMVSETGLGLESVNAYNNFVILPKNNLSECFRQLYVAASNESEDGTPLHITLDIKADSVSGTVLQVEYSDNGTMNVKKLLCQKHIDSNKKGDT